MAETLAHSFVLNGTHYDIAFTEFLKELVQRCWSLSMGEISKDCWPFATFKIIGLSRINAGRNPHIYTALQFLKLLGTSPKEILVDLPVHHYWHFHHNWWWLTAVNNRKYFESLCQRGKNPDWWWIRAANHRKLFESVCQRRRNLINSGRIYRIQRQIRLMKFQNEIRLHFLSRFLQRGDRNWNRKVISQFLIPILDQCPKSDKLLALLTRRTRYVCVKYTLRRQLRDAVYRYIRRTSEVGSE